MSETNKGTLESYDAKVEEYVEGTPHDYIPDAAQWIERGLEDLDKDAKILEVGSGFGRGANFIEGLGYAVERTDASRGLIEYQISQGKEASYLNVLEDDIDGKYDVIFADGVLIHFTQEEAEVVLKKFKGALSDNGRIIISMKMGEGEEWTDAKLGSPRFFHYWAEDDFEALLREAGFTDIVKGDGFTGHNKASWLYIVAK